MRIKFLLVVLTILTFLTPAVHAQTDFSLEFDVSYVFDENGNALVTKRITLTNLNTNTYPSVYMVDVPDDASHIAAFDENGQLEMTTVQEGGRKMARISLPKQHVGINQKSNVNLSFETGMLAKQEVSGDWQIVIPPFTADEHIISYNTSVQTPEAWGSPSFSSPKSAEPGKWTMSEQREESIVFMFGKLPTVPAENTPNKPLSSTLLIVGVMGGLLVTAILFFIYNKKFRAS
ncbi:hypothetical protein HY469_01290 [Candidatus Roizmanbacteria bacterium]|nr:hypothetical protein [Candidatus Roizmanbacteria bacterium]